jgi:hypothetical protein
MKSLFTVIFAVAVHLCIGQTPSHTVTKEPVIFRITKKGNPQSNIPFTRSTVTLNQILSNYGLAFRPTKKDPPNIQELLNYSLQDCVISCAIKGIIRDFSYPASALEMRQLPYGTRVFFEKVYLRTPNGSVVYTKAICGIKK